MKTATWGLVAVLGWGWLIAPATGQSLDIGSPAPKLSVSNWIKGLPVDLASVRGRQISVVEFWATWCGPCVSSVPHLTELQRRYASRGVQVVAITQADESNTLERVQQFVRRWGEKMDYTVGFDANGETYKAYMDAADQGGIPTVFVVDQAGRIAWIGYPDDGLDDVLEELLSGAFDIKLAKRIAKIERRMEASAEMWEWEEVIAALDEAIALKPHQPGRWMRKFFIHTHYLENVKEAKRCARRALELAANDPDKTARIASDLISEEDEHGCNRIAADALAGARKKAPMHPDLRIAQFRVLAAMSEEEQAMALAAETIDLLEDDAPRLSRFAEVLSSPKRAKKCGDLALRAVQLAIESEPEEPRHYATKFYILDECKKDYHQAGATGHYLIQKAAADADFLNGFAWSLLTEKSTKGRYDQLALAAAEAMYKAPNGDRWTHLDTLALAKFENGAVPEAIRLQKLAIANCDAEPAKAALRDRLADFEEAAR